MNQDNFRTALEFLSQISDDKKIFKNLNLSGTTLEKFQSPKGCSFIDMNFEACRMPLSIMMSCRLTHSIFDRADLMGAIIAGSDCESVSFQKANLKKVNFFKSKLLNAIFRNANLQGVNFKETNLRGADLRGANLKQAIFEGAIFDSRTLFDPEIHPQELGLERVEDDCDSEDLNIPTTDNYRPSLKYRGSLVDKEKTVQQSKKKGIMYRGVPIEDEPDEAKENPATPKPAAKPKMFYRGIRIS